MMRVRGGGCGGSKPQDGGVPSASGPGQPAPAQAQLARQIAADSFAFELTTAMLVMGFDDFEAQERIFKNTAKWRAEVLKEDNTGKLKKYAQVKGGSGKVVDGRLDGEVEILLEGKVAIFISHTW